MIAVGLQRGHLIGSKTEQEDVLVAQLLVHLHVGAVQGADGQSTVHHELHVAGTAGLLAGGGDLLGQLTGGHQLLSQGDAVVLQEDHLQLILTDGIGVDLGGQGVDELNDPLGNMVAGGRLGAKQEGLGSKLHVGVIPQLIIEVYDVQDIQQLTLILVQTLDLYVEDGVGVEHHTALPSQIGGKAALVLLLDGLHALQNSLVVLVLLQAQDGIGMDEVVVPAGALPHQSVQLGVDLGQPAAVVDAVGHVLELLRMHGICIVEHVLLQDLRVQRGHAVDGIAGADAQVGHADLAVPDDGHLGDLVHIAAEVLLQLALITGSDLLEDLPDTGQQALDEPLGPALQSLGQHGVVGVGHGVGENVPGLVPAVALHVQQDTHQLGNDQSGVGIVDLDDVLLVEIAQGAILSAVLAHDGLHGSRDEEVLLLQAQRLALVVVVIRIQHLGNDLGHSLLLHGLQVLAPGVQGHIHGHRALGVPQAQHVGVVGLVAGDLHVAGNGQNGGVAHVLGVVVALVVPVVHDLAAEPDLLGLIHLGDEPGIAQAQPVIGLLYLLAVHDLLLEDTQLVADGIAGGGDLQGGHGVQIAGSQTAQTAVAQARIGLDLKQIGGGEAQPLQGLLQGIQNAQIVGVLLQRTAHEELQRQVVDLALLALPHLVAGIHLVAGHDVPQYQSTGLKHMVRGGVLHVPSEIAVKFPDDQFGKLSLSVFSHDVASLIDFINSIFSAVNSARDIFYHTTVPTSNAQSPPSLKMPSIPESLAEMLMGEGFAALETVILLVQNSVENRYFFSLQTQKAGRTFPSARPTELLVQPWMR